MYALEYRLQCLRIMKKLDRQTLVAILDALEQLAHDPFQQPNVRHLTGSVPHAYRMRVGRWRVLYLLIHKKKMIEVIDLFMKKSEQDYQRRGF